MRDASLVQHALHLAAVRKLRGRLRERGVLQPRLRRRLLVAIAIPATHEAAALPPRDVGQVLGGRVDLVAQLLTTLEQHRIAAVVNDAVFRDVQARANSIQRGIKGSVCKHRHPILRRPFFLHVVLRAQGASPVYGGATAEAGAGQDGDAGVLRSDEASAIVHLVEGLTLDTAHIPTLEVGTLVQHQYSLPSLGHLGGHHRASAT
mmetsp:Transcript_50047/g.143895  ORF Transcript_50047/g.143895 Transcript_50047/m.143895 type:complete len:205 (-) Transcript_50047:137-751(-)